MLLKSMDVSVQDLSPGIALASAGRMRIHHLNCVSTCPLGGALMDGRSFSSLRARLRCRCHAEIDPQRPRCTPGLRFYQWMMEKDRGRRLANQARLRALRTFAAEPVEIICGHDPYEFERIARKRAAERRSVTQEMPWKNRWQA